MVKIKLGTLIVTYTIVAIVLFCLGMFLAGPNVKKVTVYKTNTTYGKHTDYITNYVDFTNDVDHQLLVWLGYQMYHTSNFISVQSNDNLHVSLGTDRETDIKLYPWFTKEYGILVGPGFNFTALDPFLELGYQYREFSGHIDLGMKTFNIAGTYRINFPWW